MLRVFMYCGLTGQLSADIVRPESVCTAGPTALDYVTIGYLLLMLNSQEKPPGWFPSLPLNVGSR